ncbi:unnamed protein product [Linum trigynum]|uniref:J domain-containing protein n=1 Tax=Linum trigynum TaxID=586398 RepID=A0AAV2GMW3_9ROSI
MPPRKSSAKQPRRKNPVKRPRGKRSVKQATHYEILSVEPNATYEEICAAYLSATTITDSTADDDDEKSLAVQKAFQVLSDTQWRAEYDEELPAARRRRNARVIEEINLMDVGFMVDVKRRHVIELLYPCLCESCYSIDSTDLCEDGIQTADGIWQRVVRAAGGGGRRRRRSLYDAGFGCDALQVLFSGSPVHD